jgi:hypothetical protein
VADPKYGCKFTDNTLTPDDTSASTRATRTNPAIIPSCS